MAAGDGSQWPFSWFSPRWGGPPLSLTHTITPKATGDQVLGQAEPTLNGGSDWRVLTLILAPPTLSSVWVSLPNLQGPTPEQGKSREM